MAHRLRAALIGLAIGECVSHCNSREYGDVMIMATFEITA
jgi:hypothetical protein